MPDQLVRLVYRSEAKISHTDSAASAALADILKVSVRLNRRAKITGCLALPDGRFVQVLEGPRREVEALFDRIRADVRHENVTVIGEWPITARLFSGWAMALPDPSPLDQQSLRVITQTGCGSQVISILLGLTAQVEKLFPVVL